MRRRLALPLTLAFVGLFALPAHLWRCEAYGADAKGADAAAIEAYVAVDALPVFSADGLIAVLKRGEVVTVVDTAPPDNSGDFYAIKWTDAGKQQTGLATRHGFTKTKPEPNAAPAAERKVEGAPDAATERKRLEGSWTIAGMCVLGQFNPDSQKPAGPNAPSPFPAGVAAPAGMANMAVAPIAFYMPGSRFYRFHGDSLTKWSELPTVDDKKQVTWQPQHHAELTFVVDPATNPGRLDTTDPRMPPEMRQPTTGIYRWEGDDVLVWATDAAIGFGLMAMPRMPGAPAKPRLAGFKPEQLKQATVVYLIRVDEKKHPAPPAPKTPAQLQGGNAF